MNTKEMGVTVHVRLPTERMDETQSNAAMMSAPSCIASERLEAIDQRITEVAKYYSDMIGLQELSLDRITDRLCLLERRIVEDENNYGRALALLEDHVRDLEAVGESVAERLCRLESSTKTRKGDGARDVAVLYRCNACDPGDGLPPCVCVLSQNLGVPEGCLFTTKGESRVAAWKEVDQDLCEIILDGIFAGMSKRPVQTSEPSDVIVGS